MHLLTLHCPCHTPAVSALLYSSVHADVVVLAWRHQQQLRRGGIHSISYDNAAQQPGNIHFWHFNFSTPRQTVANTSCQGRCYRQCVRSASSSRGRTTGYSQAWAATSHRLRNQRQHCPTVVCARMSEGERSDRGLGVLEWTGSLIPQGVLVKGVKAGWRFAWTTLMRELAPQGKDGSYVRPQYLSQGAIGDPAFPAEAGRYHVYVGNACPWCHRVVLALLLRGLLPSISVSQMADDPERASRGGWVFDTPDPNFGCRDLREVYEVCSPGYRGRCTAPLLVDKKARRIVSNESSDIMRMLNRVSMPGSSEIDLYPEHLRQDIDGMNEMLYDKINNGVYKSGFATTQAAYDRAQRELYAALDVVEARLSQHRFLVGDRFTESDLRLYPTIIRYDSAYAVLFKCSKKRIADFPNLKLWLSDVYQIRVGTTPQLQVKDTFDVEDGMRSYFGQLFPLNAGGIIPSGPNLVDLGLNDPSERGPRKAEEIFHHRLAPAAVVLA